ncbi:MAG: NHLP bacteriocin system secretion protein [Lentisphaerae bacterium GWF2_44_16]|nr:MAG: NHLP bacteriocin system secretion protein [Lentisphaerae bacterium GWF2_44_16]
MAKSLFRKKNLEKLNSPESLDSLLTITRPDGWLAVLIGGIIVIAALTWSIWGNIQMTIPGNGILIYRDGAMDVISIGAGQITDITVSPGSKVHANTVIARLALPELKKNIEDNILNCKDFEKQHSRLEKYYERNIAIEDKNAEEKRKNLEFKIESLQKHLDFLENYLLSLKKLEEHKIITHKEVEAIRNQVDIVINGINDSKLVLNQVESTLAVFKRDAEMELLKSENMLNSQKRSLSQLNSRYKLFSEIISCSSGIVSEIKYSKGDMIAAGAPVATLKNPENSLEALLYVNHFQGKKLNPGMKAYVYPSTVANEDYGCILGLVTYVADYPSSPESMKKVLGNSALVSQMLTTGPLIEVRISMLRDSHNFSGFEWSSSSGPDQKIESGTMCSGKVIFKNERPIQLLLPQFKKILDID